MTPLALVTAAALVAATGPAPQPAPAPAPAQPQAQPRDFDSPPPGASPSEQALWRAAYEVDNGVLVERAAATRLQARARANGHGEALQAAAAAGRLPAERAGELSRRIEQAWAEVAAVLTQQWPVDPTRVCRNELLLYESALFVAPGPAREAQVESTRQQLQPCVAKAQVALRTLADADARLAAALDEAERALAAAPPAPATPEASSTR